MQIKHFSLFSNKMSTYEKTHRLRKKESIFFPGRSSANKGKMRYKKNNIVIIQQNYTKFKSSKNEDKFKLKT